MYNELKERFVMPLSTFQLMVLSIKSVETQSIGRYLLSFQFQQGVKIGIKNQKKILYLFNPQLSSLSAISWYSGGCVVYGA